MSPEAIRHLVRALERHRRWCRTNGLTVPTELDDVVAHVVSCQRLPQRDSAAGSPEHGDVEQLLDYDDVGKLIKKSCRTVSRLVALGELRTVGRGSGQRIPLSEVQAYIARRLEADAS